MQWTQMPSVSDIWAGEKGSLWFAFITGPPKYWLGLVCFSFEDFFILKVLG